MAKRSSGRAVKNNTLPDLRPEDAVPIRFGQLANAIGFNLRLAQVAAFGAFAQRTGQIDIRPGRYAILMLIRENPGISQTTLSHASGRDKSTLTPSLRDLEQRGLIKRAQLANDRRSYTLHLSAAGEALALELEMHAIAHDDELDRIIGPDRKAEFILALRRIAMAFNSK